VDTYQSGWRKVYVAEEGRPIIGRVGTYVEKLVAAWRVGDKAAAGRYATPEVVASLWRTSGGPAGSSWTRLSSRAWTYNGVTVTYTSPKGTVVFSVAPNLAAADKPQAVTAVR